MSPSYADPDLWPCRPLFCHTVHPSYCTCLSRGLHALYVHCTKNNLGSPHTEQTSLSRLVRMRRCTVCLTMVAYSDICTRHNVYRAGKPNIDREICSNFFSVSTSLYLSLPRNMSLFYLSIYQLFFLGILSSSLVFAILSRPLPPFFFLSLCLPSSVSSGFSFSVSPYLSQCQPLVLCYFLSFLVFVSFFLSLYVSFYMLQVVFSLSLCLYLYLLLFISFVNVIFYLKLFIIFSE